ncbi:MAG TPA: hypothetical protein VG253_19460, partial [Streptosporangiaceae bacterium]|nr:hypothetical protein [Streptosporangiaceae bacterium]
MSPQTSPEMSPATPPAMVAAVRAARAVRAQGAAARAAHPARAQRGPPHDREGRDSLGAGAPGGRPAHAGPAAGPTRRRGPRQLATPGWGSGARPAKPPRPAGQHGQHDRRGRP